MKTGAPIKDVAEQLGVKVATAYFWVKRARQKQRPQKMVQRLTGKNSISASELSRETGVRQQNLSRWGAKLSGEQRTADLERERVKLADFERWRMALEEDGQASVSTTKRIRQ